MLIKRYLNQKILYILSVVILLLILLNFITYFDYNSIAKVAKSQEREQTKQERHISKNQKDEVLNRGHQKSCEHSHMVILITSYFPRYERRDIIRNTWGSEALKSIYREKAISYEHFFIVGRTNDPYDIMPESKKYGDVIQIDIIESFYNLTEKLMYGLKWVHQNCEYKYLLKCDDDVFVNIPASINFISDYTIPSNKLYAGFAVLNARPFREDQAKSVQYSRYVVTRKEYPIDIYPPYCAGGGFFLTNDVVAAMVPLFFKRQSLKIDDVYIGILVSETRLKVEMLLTRPLLAWFWMYASDDGPQCTYNSTNIVRHKVRTANCMERLYNFSIGKL